MRRAMDETSRRRTLQESYNEAHGITPQSIVKPIDAALVAIAEADYVTVPLEENSTLEEIPPERMEEFMAELEEKMREAARKFDFKQAASYRDKLQALRNKWVAETS
jgi:excinuclease ABC subunit B